MKIIYIVSLMITIMPTLYIELLMNESFP